MQPFRIDGERCHVIGFTYGQETGDIGTFVPANNRNRGKVALIIRAVPKPQSSTFLAELCKRTPEELGASFAAWKVPKDQDLGTFETVRAEVLARIKQEISVP